MSGISVTWIEPSGGERRARVREGLSLMEAAVQNGVHGVIGECGGGLMCATCHVLVDEAFLEAVGRPGPVEEDMLDLTASERRTESRLSCQLIASRALDGIVLTVPPG